jgi:hypothetical protein
MELDKSYLTISVAAIGLWITLITALKEGLFVSTLSVLLCVASLVAFAVTCGLVLRIFHLNREVISEMVIEKPEGPSAAADKKTKLLDGIVQWCFGAGIALLMLFGIISVVHFLPIRSSPMAGSDKTDDTPIIRPGTPLRESFNGLHPLRPQMATPNLQVPAPTPVPATTPPAQTGGEKK